MEIPKQVATINNDTIIVGIVAIAIVLVVVSLGSCNNRDSQIASDEKIRMAELRLEYNQPIENKSQLGKVIPNWETE